MNIQYYDTVEDPEHVSYESIDEAIEGYIDNLTYEEISNLPQTITVFIFDEKEPKLPSTDWLLTTVIDTIDEDYLSEYMDPTEPTDIMETAAEMFLYIIKNEYTPKVYQSNSKIDVNILYWLVEHNPTLLREIKQKFPNGRLIKDV